MTYHRRTDCRVCGARELETFLELGPQPLANSFLKSPAEFAGEAKYPLDVAFCPGCTLVQSPDVVDPETLFAHYVYVTGTSEAMAAHNHAYAAAVAEILQLTAKDRVVEAASNDGSLLKCFKALGVRTLGVEPATNIAQMARDAGIETENVFLNGATGARLRGERGASRAAIANNVLAHVDDTVDFLTGLRRLIADDGRVIVEVPYLGELLHRVEYDTIYHEHLCYFSVTALMRAFERAGMWITRVDHVAVHGGSLRVFGAPREGAKDHAEAVKALAAQEAADGFADAKTYRAFAARVAAHRDALRALLLRLKSEGKSIAAYGAPAKGNTMLNYCGIGTDLVAFTVDKNPLKVGSFTPGMHLQVKPAAMLAQERPDYALILAWNFADEIMRQQEEYRRGGGRFIVPIPEPRIV